MKPIPTIKELTSSISNDFNNKLNILSDYLRKVLDIFSLVMAGQFHLSYLYLRDIQDNVFPDTATTLENGGTLERLGEIYLNRGMFASTIGVFKVSVDAVAGSVLRANLTFKSNEGSLNTGQVYVLDAEYICTGINNEITIRSIGSGTTYNLAITNNLTITEPVIGVEKTVTVTQVVEQPKASETIELYREAILTAIQLEPQGGSRADYRQWSTDAQGVRKVYPYVRDVQASIVDVYVEATLVDGIGGLNGNGIPTATILGDVLEVLEYDPDISKAMFERGRRPAQAFVEVKPITVIPIDITIIGLSLNTVAIQETIKSSIKDLLYNVRPFISGADLRRNKNDILYYGKVQSVVTESLINGNFFNELSLQVDGNVEVSYEFTLGNIPYLRNLTFL